MSSITEVARRAGVSPATASRVVSEADYPVSAATRERVLEAARELDYVPNALARGLLKSRVPVVAVIVHDITDPYFAEVVRGVEDGASAAGYLVITCSSERDAVRERSYVRLLRSMRAAAVVFAGSGLDDAALNEEMDRHLAAMRADGAAVVHLSPHAGGAPEVGVDNAAGIAAMVAALVELGHREIAFLAGPRSLFVAGERLAGYRRGLEAAGIAYDERLVVRTTFDAAGGALGVDTLRAGGVPFTAVCCANDLLAIGALQRLAAARRRRSGRGLRRGLRRHLDRGVDGARALDGAAAAARPGPAGVPARRRDARGQRTRGHPTADDGRAARLDRPAEHCPPRGRALVTPASSRAGSSS